MPRRIFPAGTVTNTTGAPLRLTFYATSATNRRETDLWTIDSSNNLSERIPNGVILTDSSGVYAAFAGPDDIDELYMNAHNGSTRTGIAATGFVASAAQASTRLATSRTVLGMGDSLTAASGRYTSMYSLAALRSNGKFYDLQNSGTAGNTTTQMLARFATDVVAYTPDIVVVLGGTNDMAQTDYTVSGTIANLQAMITLARAANIVPILCLVPPNTTQRAKVAKLNFAIAALARSNRVPLADLYQPLIDPSTGTYISGYSGDGIHPTLSAAAIASSSILDALEQVPGGTPFLASDNSDSFNMLSNGLFLNSGSGLGTSWSVVNTPSGAAHSIVTDGQVAKGNWQRITMTAATDYHAITQTASTGFAVGDVLLFSGRVSAHDISGTGQWSIQVNRNGSFGTYIAQTVTAEVDGVFQFLYTVPASTTTIGIALLGKGTGGGGSITVDFAQVGLYNLTTIGASA